MTTQTKRSRQLRWIGLLFLLLIVDGIAITLFIGPLRIARIGFLTLGRTFHQSGNDQMAVSMFSQAINTDPTNSSIYVERARILSRLGDGDASIADYSQAIELEPSNVHYILLRGEEYGRQKKYDLALLDFETALQLNPNSAGAYYDRGYNYYLQRKVEQALPDLDKAIELDPSGFRGLYYYTRGSTHAHLGNYEAAIEDTTTAIEEGYTGSEAYYTRALCYRDLDMLEESNDDLAMVIQLDPTYAMAYYQRGLNLINLGDSLSALEDFRKFVEIYETDDEFRQFALDQVNALSEQ